MTDIKVAIVTGAGSGIGEAAAKRFVKDGYKVVLNGRTVSKLKKVKKAINSDDNVLICEGDVSNPDDVQNIIKQTIKEFGHINVLVNNAGIAVQGNIEEVSNEDLDKQMAINVHGMFMLAREAIPYIKETQGAIINTSSVSGFGGDWGMIAYNTSKGAVTNMTKAMALDYGKDGVRINAVAPSFTKTDLTAGMEDNKDLMQKFEERIPMGRGAQPEEIGDVIAFLASNDARFVNGVILPVDGGLSASNGQPPLG